MTPEGRVKERVKRALANHYRFMPVQNGMGAPGLDFYCCCNGCFVAVETKVPGKPLTLRQRQTAEAIAKNGGFVFVVRDDDDIVHMMHVLNVLAAVKVFPVNGLLAPGTIYDTMVRR